MERVFLDIDIGSAQQYAIELEEHNRVVNFLALGNAQYGLSPNIQVGFVVFFLFRCIFFLTLSLIVPLLVRLDGWAGGCRRWMKGRGKPS